MPSQVEGAARRRGARRPPGSVYPARQGEARREQQAAPAKDDRRDPRGAPQPAFGVLIHNLAWLLPWAIVPGGAGGGG
jgi:hypothetical protein